MYRTFTLHNKYTGNQRPYPTRKRTLR